MSETAPLPPVPDVLQTLFLWETKDIPVSEKLELLRTAAEGLQQQGRQPTPTEAAALLAIVLALTDESYSVYDLARKEFVEKK